jgi:hypothetical protein
LTALAEVSLFKDDHMDKDTGRSSLLAIVALAAIAFTASCSKDKPDASPSFYSGKDDLQYYPPGPEFKLTKQAQAIEEYKRRQQGEPESNPPDVDGETKSEDESQNSLR